MWQIWVVIEVLGLTKDVNQTIFSSEQYCGLSPLKKEKTKLIPSEEFLKITHVFPTPDSGIGETCYKLLVLLYFRDELLSVLSLHLHREESAKTTIERCQLLSFERIVVISCATSTLLFPSIHRVAALPAAHTYLLWAFYFWIHFRLHDIEPL